MPGQRAAGKAVAVDVVHHSLAVNTEGSKISSDANGTVTDLPSSDRSRHAEDKSMSTESKRWQL